MFRRGGRTLVGMVHVGPLPGTPRSHEPVDVIVQRAASEAATLAQCGFDAVLLENMHDVPYLRREVGPEIVAAMTAVASEVARAIAIPFGIQVLACAKRAALACAHASGGSFIRAEGFCHAAVADEGLLDEADAGPLLRFRRAIGADRIAVLADVRKKHSSHAITADLDISEAARAAAFVGADAIVVTGVATGRPVDPMDLAAVRDAVDVPVVVGSGATPQSVATLLRFADAIIVGSSIKAGGRWDGALDAARAAAFIAAAAP